MVSPQFAHMIGQATGMNFVDGDGNVIRCDYCNDNLGMRCVDLIGRGHPPIVFASRPGNDMFLDPLGKELEKEEARLAALKRAETQRKRKATLARNRRATAAATKANGGRPVNPFGIR